MMDVEIVEAGPGDAVEACDVVRRSIREICRPDYVGLPNFQREWLANKTPRNMQNWIEDTETYALAARANGNLIGFGLLGSNGKILLCYVLPEWLYKGVGKGLLARMELQAKDWGLTALRTDSTVTALEFYRRNGYEPEGTPVTIGDRVVECSMVKRNDT